MAKSITDLAFEVLEGKWGSGLTRKRKLTKAGYDYNKVQAKVNDILKKKSVDTIAKEVIDGKWGAGETRKKRLKLAGYNYDAVQKRVNEILHSEKPYQNLKPSDYVSNVVYIGQATSDENGKVKGGKAGDQKGGEVSISKYSYSTKGYNNWKYVFRAKDASARLRIAQATIDACNNNHVGYDQNSPDRKTYFKEAKKVGFFINKITANCETTCSELANVSIAAAGLKSYLPENKKAYVESLSSTLSKSAEFTRLTDLKSLEAGDILVSDSHTAIVVKAPKPTTKKGYTGTFPSYRLKKTRSKAIEDGIKWGKWIANNNDFHYGWGEGSHRKGCYFCGTQPMSKKTSGIKMWETTYCCNPFVTALLGHGVGIPTMLNACANYKAWQESQYKESKEFDNLGKPAKSSLQAGDILCCSNAHVMYYIGNNKVVEAANSDDNVIHSKKWNDSIQVANLTDNRWNSKSYGVVACFRWNGNGIDCDRVITHGEVSDRVAHLQAYLDWYFDGKVGKPYDGIYGDNTFKWCKEFQEKEIGKGQGDGLVGQKTINAMKKVKK